MPLSLMALNNGSEQIENPQLENDFCSAHAERRNDSPMVTSSMDESNRERGHDPSTHKLAGVTPKTKKYAMYTRTDQRSGLRRVTNSSKCDIGPRKDAPFKQQPQGGRAAPT
ncbi:hypothetical protein EVAR_46591_1 [Eumeta japonica]|uniref:Uncharacterized protein n=1 Tax=Eumeta variegata TaxID=151549 RepID=A0A4C1WTA4_EUMVA|nr:hypothetical protein EVAR_46591_1 [Eumeta japonica]